MLRRILEVRALARLAHALEREKLRHAAQTDAPWQLDRTLALRDVEVKQQVWRLDPDELKLFRQLVDEHRSIADLLG